MVLRAERLILVQSNYRCRPKPGQPRALAIRRTDPMIYAQEFESGSSLSNYYNASPTVAQLTDITSNWSIHPGVSAGVAGREDSAPHRAGLVPARAPLPPLKYAPTVLRQNEGLRLLQGLSDLGEATKDFASGVAHVATRTCRVVTRTCNEARGACRSQTCERSLATRICNSLTSACSRVTGKCNRATRACKSALRGCSFPACTSGVPSRTCSYPNRKCNRAARECRIAKHTGSKELRRAQSGIAKVDLFPEWAILVRSLNPFCNAGCDTQFRPLRPLFLRFVTKEFLRRLHIKTSAMHGAAGGIYDSEPDIVGRFYGT
jgi:hypothetical protein